MADRMRKISDEIIELMEKLSTMPPDSAKLGRALHDIQNPPKLSFDYAQQAISRLSRELTEHTGIPVNLLETRGKTGTFATSDCRALLHGLARIRKEREACKEEYDRRRKLEWHQLSTCLESEPLRIGAYQAHAERFMVSAVQLVVEYFPWLDCTLEIEPSRVRSGKFTGQLQRRLASGDFDFILVPRESTEDDLKPVYTYSFRVVGHPAVLAELTDGKESIHISKLRGHRLIVGSEGSSSRQRLRGLLKDAGISMTEQFELIEEINPNIMRIRAETGQGLAVMSDEYSAVGGGRIEFPYLVRGAGHAHCSVEMGLLRKDSANRPRYEAFDFVVDQLLAREKERERAVAQA